MNRHDSPQRQEKLQGYLEKRSKMNFWRWWRKYWFVLDGKMLLYYKTKESYELLGRCKGSINMALAQAAQPSCASHRSYPLEIITRTKTVQLSACDEENRQRWLAALQNAIRLPEVSSPIFQRLSSRLSGNVGKYFPDSEPDDISSVDPCERLERHAEENEDERDSEVPQPVDGAMSGKKGKISFKDEETTEETTHTIYTACTTERHISTYSFREAHNTNDVNTARYDSDASTITLLDEPSNEFKPKDQVKSFAAKEVEWFRPRSRSLYEEILDEVLEITGQRLPSSRVCSTTGDDDECGAVSVNKAEITTQEITTDEGKLTASDKDDQDTLNVPCSKRSSKSCPPKPPRLPSKKITAKKDASGNTRKKVIKTDTDKACERSFDVGLEVDAYDSANESCYVTAESSDYEGDNSSVNSSNCNLQQHTVNSCDNLQDQLLHSSENLQGQILHSSDNLQDQILHSSDNLQEQSQHSSDDLQDQILHPSENLHDQSTESNNIFCDENNGLRENLQDQNMNPTDKFNQITKSSNLQEHITNSSGNTHDQTTCSTQQAQETNVDDHIFYHTTTSSTTHCEQSTVYSEATVSITLFEPMISSSDGNQLDPSPTSSETMLNNQTSFLSPKPYEASLESQESLESVKPQTGSLCNMLDVTDDEDDDDVFTNSPARLPESSTPHPVTSHNIRPPHFSPINDAPPMKPSTGYSFSVVRSAELVWTYDSPQAKPRKFSQ